MRGLHYTRGDESALERHISGGGSAITTGMKGFIDVPFDCWIEEAALEGQTSGSLVLDLWKCTYAQFDGGSTHPVDGDSITASAPLTISSGTKVRDTSLTGWTRTLTKGDIIAPNVDSNDNLTLVTLVLKVRKR
jgi:hypothetical protein